MSGLNNCRVRIGWLPLVCESSRESHENTPVYSSSGTGELVYQLINYANVNAEIPQLNDPAHHTGGLKNEHVGRHYKMQRVGDDYVSDTEASPAGSVIFPVHFISKLTHLKLSLQSVGVLKSIIRVFTLEALNTSLMVL